MKFTVNRDFLDGILVQHPPKQDADQEIRANANLNFLPSSPDGTMHTAVARLSFHSGDNEHPFITGGWRFLFSSDEQFDPQSEEGQQQPFLRNILAAGAAKVMAVVNTNCMHANMPLIPLDASQLVRGQAKPKAE